MLVFSKTGYWVYRGLKTGVAVMPLIRTRHRMRKDEETGSEPAH
jgi:hypothetical protein